jgi:hypothetical protein
LNKKSVAREGISEYWNDGIVEDWVFKDPCLKNIMINEIKIRR